MKPLKDYPIYYTVMTCFTTAYAGQFEAVLRRGISEEVKQRGKKCLYKRSNEHFKQN